MMLAGGGEELCHSEVCVFDSLYAASLKNDAPKTTPAPYDRDRDGLVIGEGAGMMVLESLEHARARGAKIYAEIVGFASNCDGTHVTRPEQETMYRCMEAALAQAALPPQAIGYVSGHGTATEQGDIAETRATARLFPHGVPPQLAKKLLRTHPRRLRRAGKLVCHRNDCATANSLPTGQPETSGRNACGAVDFIMDTAVPSAPNTS